MLSCLRSAGAVCLFDFVPSCLGAGASVLAPSFLAVGGENMAVSDIALLFAEVVKEAIPITIVWYLGELVVGSFLRAAFGGRLTFKAL